MSEDANYVEMMGFHKRQIIFREGDAGERMFEVDRGRVGIYVDYGKQKQRRLAEVEEGGFFGEMGMVRGFPRSATAVSLEDDTRIRPITWETLGFYFKQSPAKIIGIMQQMGQRIQALSEDYIAACGAVEELSERQNALIRENRRMAKKLADRQIDTKCDAHEGMPVWEKITGESQSRQDERFRRYIAEYRNYMETREKKA